MSEHTMLVHVERFGRVAADLEAIVRKADRTVWKDAAAVTRTYDEITVRAEWQGKRAVMRISGELDPRDVPAFVELYFHDLFLMMNIAVPGAFSAVVTGEGAYRMTGLRLHARMFEYAWVSAARRGWPSIDVLPFANVAKWYESLGTGKRQVAKTPVEKALFHLLQIARAEEGDVTVVRLRQALEALRDRHELRSVRPLRKLFEAAPVVHPMHDDQLDGEVEDELTEAVDVAASVIVSTLQAHAANH